MVPESQTLTIPEGLSFVQAAAIPETFFTVWANVFQMGQAKAGETVLVHGGSSGIGTTALMLCNALGMKTFATVGSDEKVAATDVTFSKTPPLGCVLQAIKIPPVGGDTLWSSNTAAFKGLPLELQQKLRGLTATHDIRKSFPLERFAHNEEEREKLLQTFKRNPPVVHPVVRTHPVTGESLLFVSEGFTTHINELPEQESEQLLDFLFEHATQEQFHLRWKWQDGDIAIWDNRCTQHKALFDYGDAHRIMHRATINGDVPFYKEEQQPELAEA